MTFEILFALAAGIAIGVTASIAVYDILERTRLKSLKQRLSKPVLESKSFYKNQGLEPTTSDSLIWDIHITLGRCIENSEQLWSGIDELFNELCYFATLEFEYRRHLHTLRKYEVTLQELQKALPADNHLLLTARHYTRRMSDYLQPQEQTHEHRHLVLKEANTGLPQVARLIKDMEGLVAGQQQS
jgi:hypothetical protein